MNLTRLVVIPAVVCALTASAGAETRTITLPLSADTKAFSVTDLDGDGRFDFLARTEPGDHDPWHWNPSTREVRIETFGHDGEARWRHQLGRGIESGVHYAPVLSYDVDGDGKWEVYAKDATDPAGEWPEKVTQGEEWLIKLDPETGEVVKKVAWPERMGNYNNYSRNYITIAYLDGENPSVIATRGTYGKVQAWAYDKDLNLQWKFTSSEEYVGRHNTITADVDQDGKDEIILGMCVVDDDGSELWGFRGHADALYVGDLDPSREGIEMFVGMGENTTGIGMLDAATGEWIWKHEAKMDGQGICADIHLSPGIECYARIDHEFGAEPIVVDGKEYQWLWFRPDGTTFEEQPAGQQRGRPTAAYLDGSIYETPVEGNNAFSFDIEGDWREEIISLDGKVLTITTPDGEPEFECPSLREDRQYLLQSLIGRWMVGYPQQALPSGAVDSHSAREAN